MNTQKNELAVGKSNIGKNDCSDSCVKVVRFGRTINKSERLSVIFGEFDGWITGRHALKAIRFHRLFMLSSNRKKRSKWLNAMERALKRAPVCC